MDRQVQQKNAPAISESPDDDDLKLVDDKAILAVIGMRPTWLYEARRDGRFPKSLKIGRSNRTPLGEVRRWMRERIDARPPVKSKTAK